MKPIKVFTSIIVCIMLILSLIMLQASLSINNCVLSEEYYMEKFEDNKIYDKFEKSISYSFSTYSVKNKIPTKYTEDLIDNKWVQIQFNTVTTGLISILNNSSNTLPVIDTKTITENFNYNVTSNSNGQAPVGIEKEFSKIYETIPFTESFNNINSNRYTDTILKYKNKINSIKYLSFSLIFISVILIFILFFTFDTMAKRRLSIAYCLIISGILSSLMAFTISNSNIVLNYIESNLLIPKDSIFPKNASLDLLADIVNGFFSSTSKYSAIFVVVGILILAIVTYLEKRNDNVFWYKHKPLK